MTTRRNLLVMLGIGVFANPFDSYAQLQNKIWRIGFLTPSSSSVAAPYMQAFRLGLRDRGWVEGNNITIEYRHGEGKNDRVPELAADLVRLKVDVIVVSNTLAAITAQKATRTIPIVVALAGDPVVQGLVETLARPGGNVTGLSQMSSELVPKRLELLKEMIPKLSHVVVLLKSQGATTTVVLKELDLAARQVGVQLHYLEISGPEDLDKAFENATRARVGALYIMASPMIMANIKRIADLAAKHRLPSIFQESVFTDVGGLVTYGPDYVDMYRRAATYVDKILKGTKPGDLPLEQPTKFELVINKKTAKALGLTIPQNVLFRANRVIE